MNKQKRKLNSRPPEKSNEDLNSFISGSKSDVIRQSTLIEPIQNDNEHGEKNSEKNSNTLYNDLFPDEHFHGNLPWNDPYVREDLKKYFSFRFSEPYMLKLQFIRKKTGWSTHKFCEAILLPAIDKKIEELTSH